MKHPGLIALAAVAASCATAPAPGGGVKLYAMNCGGFEMKNTGMFSPNHEYDGKPGKLSNPCFLIRHPKGDLVWDAGIPPALATPKDALATLVTRVIRDKTMPEQLALLGLKTSDIEFFSLSHSHYDHVGEANLYAGSTWIVDAAERAWMFRPDARKAGAFATYSALEMATTQTIETGADYDVFGDGSVVLIPAHGHTPGHRAMLVKLANAGAVLIAGDMWHLADAQKLRTVPGGNTDKPETLRSMDKVEELALANKARLVRQHVPEDFAALPAFPAGLD